MKMTGGSLKNRTIKAPKGVKTRPTSEKVRQIVFNIVQDKVEGAVFLDLFAGSGALGMEALSRGAKKAVFVEKDFLAIKTLRENLKALQLTPFATVLAGDVFLLSKHLKGTSFDLIYIDPPYAQGLQEKALVLIDRLDLLDEKGILFIEETSHEPLDIPLLNTLTFKRKRKTGSTTLYEFESVSKVNPSLRR